jgi:glycosyltransferase involved in cell wall biosynthesis
VLLWVRGNYFIPDARVLWVKPSIAYLSELLEREAVDILITTGPPHSLHLIGHALKKKHGLKWVADFRDPWTSIAYHGKLKLGKSAAKRHRYLEKMVLNAADKIIVTSKTTAREFGQISGKPISVITNGYDPKIFAAAPPATDPRFVISHIGSLLSERNPIGLWKVLGQLVAESDAFRERFCLRLVGIISPDVLESLKSFGLEPYLERVDYVPHSEAVHYQQTSQLLLLIEIDSDETRGILPGKLFEYLASRRPILAIGPTGWEAGEIVLETGAGAVFNYHSVDALREKITAWFGQYLKGGLENTGGEIEKYSRRELTRKLASELKWE